MRRQRALQLLVIILSAASSLACVVAYGPGVAPAPSGTVKVDDSYNDHAVDVPQGGSLIVSLLSNPSTGYHWEVTEISDRQVLGEVKREFRPGPTAAGRVGVPGADIWTFSALGRGTTRLLMRYVPPGRTAEESEKTFDIQVNVY